MPDISMCGSTECPSRDTCYRATATPSEYQSWADFEATRNGRERCDSYIEYRRHPTFVFHEQSSSDPRPVSFLESEL